MTIRDGTVESVRVSDSRRRYSRSFTPRLSVSVMSVDLVGRQAQQVTQELDAERCPTRCAARDVDDVVIDVQSVM